MGYPGGKGKTYQHLINLMPPHEIYIETHLGGGAVLRHKRPAARNIAIERNEQVINYWRAQGPCSVELVHGRAEQFLATFPFSGSELIYCDPPYVGSTRTRERVYTYDYSDADHQQLLALLTNLPCNVMISGYANELYDRELASWNIHNFLAMSQTGLRQETVWFNFEPPMKLHDSRFVGSTFRHRQTIKRRLERLKAKVACMDPIERHALITWMSQTYSMPSKEA
jgi:DNA adenine methylase